MKKLLLLFVATAFFTSCSKETETLQTSQDLSFEVASQNSNIGFYKGVFTTDDSQTRAVVDIIIPNNRFAAVYGAWPTATLTLENGTITTARAVRSIQYGEEIEDLQFENDDISFLFSVNNDGTNPEITNVTYQNKTSYVVVNKHTTLAPVTPITGTYICTVCNNHPSLNLGPQTFNFTIVGNVVTTNVMAGAGNFTGTGTQTNPVIDPVTGTTTTDIAGSFESVAGSNGVATMVEWTAKHRFSTLPTVECSDIINSSWTWFTNNYGNIMGTFSNNASQSCNVPVQLLDLDFQGYTGAGFSPTPSAGQLDSNVIIATGLSDGSVTYGGTKTNGDFARGSSTGNVSTGGLYNFNVASGNASFGIQPAGSDFTPGTVELRILNTTGNTLTRFDVSYLVYINNNEGRGNSLDFSYSTDNVTFTEVPALNITSAAAEDALGFVSNTRSTIINTSVANGAYLYIKFTGDDVNGSNSRDEFAIDDISVIGTN